MTVPTGYRMSLQVSVTRLAIDLRGRVISSLLHALTGVHDAPIRRYKLVINSFLLRESRFVVQF